MLIEITIQKQQKVTKICRMNMFNIRLFFERKFYIKMNRRIKKISDAAGTKIWAHRGASAYYPENTMIAFKKAYELGADGIELDVQLSRDGQLVVAHDETIDRVSDKTGFIKDYDLAELKHFKFNKMFPECEDFEIPTLEEVYAWAKYTPLEINVELKTNKISYDGIEEKALELTKKYVLLNRVIFSCFNKDSLNKIKSMAPNARVGLLFSSKNDYRGEVDYAVEHKYEALHPSYKCLSDRKFVRDCFRKNVNLNVWNVKDDKQIRKCISLGVSGIITDYPDKVRKKGSYPDKVRKKGLFKY